MTKRSPRRGRPRLDNPRIEPVDNNDWNDAQRAVFERIEQAGRMYNVHKTLANHPALARDWLKFGTYILRDNLLPPREREILILRIGCLCDAEYEMAQHARIGKRAGLTDDDLRRIAEGPDCAGTEPARSAAAGGRRRTACRRVHQRRHLGRRCPRPIARSR